MRLTFRSLASGPGWQVTDVVCRAGPRDRPFEEQHDAVSIAIVSEGTFQYRSSVGNAVLGPGSLLLGSPGRCFECGHEHAVGDRCLSFHYAPEHFEAIVAPVPGVRRAALQAPSLPPLPDLLPLAARAEAARDDGDAAALEELGIELAVAVTSALAETAPRAQRPSARDERRVTAALRRIERDAAEPLSLADLAAEAATSRFHFLRVFREIVGLTPHQALLRARLNRAAQNLHRSDAPITTIAFACGFNDLSTFNHRFRRAMKVTPSGYRAQRR
jgi:AraC-like DNA-binding protein